MRGAGQAARAGSRPAAPGPPADSGACRERRSRRRTRTARRCRARTAAALAQALLDKPPCCVSAACTCRQTFVERRTDAASVERRTCVVMLGQGAPRTRMCGQHAENASDCFAPQLSKLSFPVRSVQACVLAAPPTFHITGPQSACMLHQLLACWHHYTCVLYTPCVLYPCIKPMHQRSRVWHRLIAHLFPPRYQHHADVRQCHIYSKPLRCLFLS